MTQVIYVETLQYSSLPIECALIFNDFWFRAEDVAIILGYTDSTKAIKDIVDEDDKRTLWALVCDLGDAFIPPRVRESKRDVFISLCGLESLGYRSQWRDVQLFRKWIWHDVVPALRTKREHAFCPWRRPRDDDDDDQP